MASSQIPGARPKEVVLALVKFDGREPRSVTNTRNGEQVQNTYVTYKCPRPGCSSGTVSFIEKTRCCNPYNNIKTCYEEQHIQMLFSEAEGLGKIVGGSVPSHFATHVLSRHDCAIVWWTRLVGLKNRPLSHIEDSESRYWFASNLRVARSTVVKEIYQLVQLVEKRIWKDIQNTKGR